MNFNKLDELIHYIRILKETTEEYKNETERKMKILMEDNEQLRMKISALEKKLDEKEYEREQKDNGITVSTNSSDSSLSSENQVSEENKKRDEALDLARMLEDDEYARLHRDEWENSIQNFHMS